MCVRFIPSAAEEAQAVLDARGTGRHGIRFVEHPDSIHDAHPGSTVSLFVPDGAGSLKVARLEWGGSRSTESPTSSSTPASSQRASSSGVAVAACRPRPSQRPLPRPGARLLREPRHREGPKREDREARPSPVPLPPPRRPRVPPRSDPAGRSLLHRHHGAQYERRTHPRPHAARPRA